MVLLGDTKENLQRYPCLSRRSISFSQPGFVKVVAAHRDTHFRRLGKISTGDRVRIILKDKRVLTYRVCDMEVVSRETAERRVAEKDGGDWLVLMTCHPFTFAGAAPERFLVWARREPAEPLYEPNTWNQPCGVQGAALPLTLLPPVPRDDPAPPRFIPCFGRAASFTIDEGGGAGPVPSRSAPRPPPSRPPPMRLPARRNSG